ncbi:hypothetical protein ILYODFUR_012840 [Ilyodon furcidens]|uniref:Uncharacterized protein n=1 Tax=Ilyodon furcidens TaxID=33524 RepID=A0ABV0VE71_9TELE
MHKSNHPTNLDYWSQRQVLQHEIVILTESFLTHMRKTLKDTGKIKGLIISKDVQVVRVRSSGLVSPGGRDLGRVSGPICVSEIQGSRESRGQCLSYLLESGQAGGSGRSLQRRPVNGGPELAVRR